MYTSDDILLLADRGEHQYLSGMKNQHGRCLGAAGCVCVRSFYLLCRRRRPAHPVSVLIRDSENTHAIYAVTKL